MDINTITQNKPYRVSEMQVGETVFAVISVESDLAKESLYNKERSFAGIAQSVEQLIRNQQVACSSHVSSSNQSVRFLPGGLFAFAGVCMSKRESAALRGALASTLKTH